VLATVFAAAAATAVVAAPAANAQDVPNNCFEASGFFGYATTFIDNTTREWQLVTNRANAGSSTETLSALSPEVAPSVTGLFSDEFEQAFKASDATLWVTNSVGGGRQLQTNGVAHTLGSHSGPAIASYATNPTSPITNQWRITWVENGRLLALDESAQNTVLTLATDAGPSTTPGIAAADNGRTAGFFESYVNTHGNVTVIRPDGTRVSETSFAVRPGTGVPIAVNSVNHWLIEAQAPNTTMWEFSDSRGAVPTIFTVNGTPSVTALSDDTFQRAFLSSTNGDLFVGFDDTGLHAANNTSPSIAGAYTQGHWMAAIQSAAHHLQTIDDAGTVGDAKNASTVTLGATSSPAIANIPFCGLA
jgi:hypothetical protein